MLAAETHLDLADVPLAPQSLPVLHPLEGHQTLPHHPPNLDTERQVAVPSARGVVVALIEPVGDGRDPQHPLLMRPRQHRLLVPLVLLTLPPLREPDHRSRIQRVHQRAHLLEILRHHRAAHQVRQHRHVPPIHAHELLQRAVWPLDRARTNVMPGLAAASSDL
eukprot:CAMPEP_0180310072 /NCGR_PEP_ID=MMETSP0988-20121125/29474_1 /TAXON_ID=697907 /ORGANISM="non described non described, Strain CCMP2293" /LENGTH=163 /DNA_ID=CAMNT_0022293967 /DNA_START=274 /DNA_END=766 /DNA_ORIENTATION=+